MARHARINPLLSGLLVGSALAAGAVLPGAGVAHAAASDPECVAATSAVADRQAELERAVAAYEKQKTVWTAALSTYRRLEADESATAAQIESARLRSVQASDRMNKLYSAQLSANSALQEAVAFAQKSGCHEPKPPVVDHPTHGAPSTRPHPQPRPRPVPVHGPAPVVSVESSSSSNASAVAVSPPAGAPVVTVENTASSGGLGGWFGGWFESDDDTGPSGGATVATGSDGVVDGSYAPAGAVDAGDGSSSGLDVGHIGMAVAGLGALGLTGLGTAGLIGHRRRQRS